MIENNRLWPLLAAPLMVACGDRAPEAAPADAPGAAETAAAVAPESVDRVRIAGVLVVGENTREFRPCDGSEALWLDGPIVVDLVGLHGELAPGVEPFEGVFLDLVADIGPPPAVGPGTGYPASAIAHMLRRAAYEGWSCDDVDPALVVEARGTEPFWTLRVTETGGEYVTPEERTSLEFGPLAEDDEGWVIQGTGTEVGNVFVALTPVPCRNAMSGAYSHLEAVVEIGGRRLNGCAYLGPAHDPDAG